MDKTAVVQPLLPSIAPLPVSALRKWSLGQKLSLLALAILLPTSFGVFCLQTTYTVIPQSPCGQAEPIIPPTEVYNVSNVRLNKDRIIEWHQGAIRVPTQIYDDMGDFGTDERWQTFGTFHQFLERAYPLVHKHLRKYTVDTWSLVFEWIGSDESLQPVFLAAHQDVVPVLLDTVDQWDHPPFDGDYDGEHIWGRGATDDKSGLTSIMAAIELLLESNHKPTRTFLLGFGHDEEGGSSRGALAIRNWVVEKYGKDSISLLIDEGPGISASWGQTFGLPSVAEKGKFDLNMTVTTLGGHSSVPPDHTGIGLISLLIAQLEAHPYPVALRKSSPLWGFLQCSASYAADMPKLLKKEVVKSETDDKAFNSLPKVLVDYGVGPDWVGPGMGNPTRAMMTTTQAIDLIQGGLKVNALPEVATAVINHRIDLGSSIEELQERIVKTLRPVLEEYSLSLDGLGRSFSPKGKAVGHVQLSGAFGNFSVNPSPISSIDLANPAWNLLAGTARGVWASRHEVSGDGEVVALPAGDDLVMAPFMATGNTDTNRYWDLTPNIYRWLYLPTEESKGAHTINERVSAQALIECVRFYQALILNADGSQAL